MSYSVFGTFRANYVNLDKPVQYQNKGDAKYRIVLSFPKDDEKLHNALSKAIDTVAQAQFKGKNYDSPIHDGDEKGKEEFKDTFYLNASNKFPVLAVDAARNPMDAADIYSGCYVNATLQFYTYQSSNKGVGVSISAIQKVKDGKPLGGGNPDTTSAFAKLDVDVDDDDDLLD